MNIKAFILILFIFAALFLQAQTDCTCCTPAHQQFDFWLGQWDVYDTTGKKVGENSIIKLEDNCLLNEHWTGTSGFTGRSYNYFDQSDTTWNQIWLDNKGGNLVLKGKLENGRMVLSSGFKPGKSGKLQKNRITWSQNEDGTVTQLWEILNEDLETIASVFEGIYKRKE